MNSSIATRYPVGLIHPLTLADGRRVLVRPVLPQDSDGEQAFVKGLSPASRYRRFHVGMRELPQSTLLQLTRIDHRSHVALVAHPEFDIGEEQDDPAIVADARYVRIDEQSAEFAVAVDDRWQRQGLGSRLLRMLARHAAKNGLSTLYGDVLTDNLPMITMLRRWGCELLPRDDEPDLLLVKIAL